MFNPNVAHFSRVPAISRPSMSRMTSDGVVSTSASVFPVNISVTMEDAAWLMVQPSPSNEMPVDAPVAIYLQVERHDVAAARVAALLDDRRVRPAARNAAGSRSDPG